MCVGSQPGYAEGHQCDVLCAARKHKLFSVNLNKWAVLLLHILFYLIFCTFICLILFNRSA